ncbi:glycosyltransferase family 9 protein [Ramlibacter albus]|uniref:Glycosyltransferase family 9 protein n=1 Tax=Ramlibacter albus TaxID=2079448 RepID=A0A923M5D8_9BURK|nr:glycosyltransferase family 9 protein [Ramlibacter albus]MBC5764517.1 glycosyltransferase family 9 protein [Ramlibacter albus]
MKSILVVVTRQIGDVLLTTPLVRQARVLWPDAAIDVLGFAGTLGMLAGNPDVREAIAVPAKPGFGGTLALARRLWRRYDLALVADPGDRAHLIGLVAARERAGLLPARNSSNWWKRKLLAHAVTSGGDLSSEHVVAEKLRLLQPWGAPVSTPQVVGPSSASLPAALQAKLQPGYVVVHTPSMWPYKQWPLSHFRDLIARLAAAGRQVVLTGSGSDTDRAAVAAMHGAAPDSLLVDAGVLTFNQLAGLIRGAALYIGPDTSVSHLAAACDVPVLAIFGPTNPQRWAPWPGVPQSFERVALSQTLGKVTLIQADLPCVPCGKAGCENHRASRSDCLPAITPERVAEQALRMLS